MSIENMVIHPAELLKKHLAEKNRSLAHCHTNEEICQTLWRIEADHGRQIYDCCQHEPGNLDFFLANDKAMYRLFSAVLGAIAGRCVLCGWDAARRGEIRRALKRASGVMFPMLELEGWLRTVEEKTTGCLQLHSALEVWGLMRMLRVRVEEPNAAKIETAQYD